MTGSGRQSRLPGSDQVRRRREGRVAAASGGTLFEVGTSVGVVYLEYHSDDLRYAQLIR